MAAAFQEGTGVREKQPPKQPFEATVGLETGLGLQSSSYASM